MPFSDAAPPDVDDIHVAQPDSPLPWWAERWGLTPEDLGSAAERRRLLAHGLSDLTDEEIHRLVCGPEPHPDQSVRAALVLSSRRSPAMLRAACADPDIKVRLAALGCADCPVECVTDAVTDPDPLVRHAVARRPDLPAALAETLLEDPDVFVGQTALAHPGISPERLLSMLTSAPSRSFLRIACAHPNLDLGDPRLTTIPDHVALILLERADLTSALLSAYADSPRPRGIRTAALSHARCPSEVLLAQAQDRDETIRLTIAAHPAIPQSALDLLLIDGRGAVRCAAAASAALDPHRLASLTVSDPDVTVRIAAVRNPHCPADALTAACTRTSLVVDAAENPACPREGLFLALTTMATMPRHGSTSTLTQQAAEHAADLLAEEPWSWLSDQDLGAVLDADLTRLITPHAMDALQDQRVNVRSAVAHCAAITPEILSILVQDPDPQVQRAATDRLLAALQPNSAATP